MKKKYTSYVYVIISILIWASTPVVIDPLLNFLDVFQIILYSSLFAIVFLSIAIIINKKSHILFTYKKRDYSIMFSLGFIGIFLQYLFLYSAIDFSTAQEAFIINYLWPLCLVGFAIPILGEKINSVNIISLALGFLGAYIIATEGNFGIEFKHPFGNVLALLTALIVGLFFVLNKKYRYESITSLLIFYISAFIFAFISTLTFSSITFLSAYELLSIIWIGFFIFSISYIFWFEALKFGDTAKISNIGYLVPFISLIYIYFILNEAILVSSIIGLILIMMSIFFQHIKLIKK